MQSDQRLYTLERQTSLGIFSNYTRFQLNLSSPTVNSSRDQTGPVTLIFS